MTSPEERAAMRADYLQSFNDSVGTGSTSLERARQRAAENFAKAVNQGPRPELSVRPHAASDHLSLRYNDPVNRITLDFFLEWEEWDAIVAEAELVRSRHDQG